MGSGDGSDLIGLVPAAGRATRLPLIQGSKAMIPVWGEGRRPAMACLLDAMTLAGASEVKILGRSGQDDILSWLTSERPAGSMISHQSLETTPGVAHTLAAGLESQSQSRVITGFPDVLFEPQESFRLILKVLDSCSADVVLALFPAQRPAAMDMVRLGPGQRITEIQIKPDRTELELTWLLATWQPSFSSFLLNWVSENEQPSAESHLGRVFISAMNHGLDIRGCPVPGGRALDIGTPEDLVRAHSDW